MSEWGLMEEPGRTKVCNFVIGKNFGEGIGCVLVCI